MIVAVFTPPSRIDATNIAAFAATVGEHVARDRCIVIDCSEVVWIAIAGVRVLEIASRDVPVTLANPSPGVHLMAAVFGGEVQCRYDRMPPQAGEHLPHQRLLSVPTGGKLAS
jgi:hypothetical protein